MVNAGPDAGCGFPVARTLIALALAIGGAPALAAIDATIDTRGQLEVAAHRNHVVARLAMRTTRPLRIDATLANEMARADDFFAVGKRSFIDGGVTWLLVVTQTASRANREAGACGAGTEDVLHLVEVDLVKWRLVERSQLPLQSCLTGLSLDDDTARSLQQVLEAVPDPGHLHLTWLNHPEQGDRPTTVSVRDGALTLE